jgi:NAD(P)H dehydrogenase (quinone)
MSTSQKTLLVTGASGHLGRRVIELLLETHGIAPTNIIATTRSPEKLSDLSQRGVTVRSADFDDAETLVPAFQGADRLLLISTDLMETTGQRIRQHLNAVSAAEKAGVQHVLYTSMIRCEPGSPVVLAADHYATESALAESDMGWTILRNNIYMDLLIPTLAEAEKTGQFSNASGEGKTGYVTREDCARAAAAAVASSFDGRRTLNITGPESLSQAEIAAIATVIAEKPIQYVPLELETLIQGMMSAGLPRPMADLYASFDAGTAANQFDLVTTDFEDLTGQQPTSVKAMLTTNRDRLLQANVEPVE